MTKRLRLLSLVTVAALVVAAGGCSNSDAGDSARSGRSTSSASASGPLEPALSLVVIGDSISYNSPGDCPGCTGFVDRYAKALTRATGRKVETSNLSEHTGLTLPQLMDRLHSVKDPLSGADAIIVAIAHNSFELNNDEQCGTTFDDATSTLKDWSKVTPRCATASAANHRPEYDKLYATIASWRHGHPTLLRTLNKYNDWNGWKSARLTPDQQRRTFFMHDAWNKMLCRSADKHGFACADIYHGFNGADGTKPSGDLLAADYTHPSDRGNARIAQVLLALGFDPLA
jgi:lysophospholipase L1-like esterase